jgi:hypothetical protein
MNKEINFNSIEKIKRVTLQNTLNDISIKLNGNLNSYSREYYPTSNEITTLNGKRNLLLNEKQIIQLIINYQLKVSNNSEVLVKVPNISELLYESSLGSQMVMIFNKNKKRICVQDFKPKFIKLSKGDYNIRLQISSDNISQLEKLKNLIIQVDTKLEKPLNLNIFKNINDAINNDGQKFSSNSSFLLKKGF